MLRITIAALLLAAASLAPTAFAQGVYPNKPIRMIVPYAAGGPTDVLARVMAQKLGDSPGQNVIVENKPGASGDFTLVRSSFSCNHLSPIFLTDE